MCRMSANWLRSRTPGDDALTLVPSGNLDDDQLAGLGLTRSMCAATLCLSGSEGIERGAQAIAGGLASARRGWPLLGRALRLPVVRGVAAYSYRIVAQNRHRLNQ